MKPTPKQRQGFTEKVMRGWRGLALEDVETVFKMDERFGVIYVMGVPHVPKEGFQIGGHAAAGAANLYAADKEEEELAGAGIVTRHELENHAFMARGCDDVIQVWDDRISYATKVVLRKMRSEDFYGEPLELEEQKDDAVAFGFEFDVGGGTLRARSVPLYEGKEDARSGRWGEKPAMQSEEQDMPEERQVAAIQGRALRMLDMTNEPEEWVEASMKRLVAELILQKYDPKVIAKAMRRVRDVAWVKMEKVIEASWEREGEAERYAKQYDQARTKMKEANEESRKKEAEQQKSRRRGGT